MSNEIADLISEIQFNSKPKITIEAIAKRIGYTREHLTVEKKKGNNSDIIKLLKSEFKDLLQKERNSNNLPMDDMRKLIDATQKLAESHKNTSEANVILARMLEKRTIASDAQQMIEGALARHRAIQEVLQAYAKDGRPINVERFEADVNTRINEMVRADTTEVSIQSD